ncbi:MAG: hypothetical protein JXJ20_08495 [Anaerolineae bacterium]|nr:hypothetical protein [Anaerolineae bacterium]
MNLSSRAHSLFEAFELPGCPVCRLTQDSVHHYLDGLIYEYVNEPDTHIAVRAARGFCPTHAWHIRDHINASALGIAVLYEGMIRTLLRELGEGGRRQVTRAASTFKPQGPCPACEHQAHVEDHLLRNLLDHLDQQEFTGAFSRSAGLCLPHLRAALDTPGDADAKARLLDIQRDIWTELQQDLAEFIRKRDYRFANEVMGREGDSPRRAIEQMAGARGLR